ncbi:Hypothetical protein R9X50_00632100 [Acrodontium crateriforme]|uniref:Uncharacterized protein n=1 Tax=Acrodontium crateriforme TaxID=150365 RepID=A0AAQ3R6Q5_9PEZI|nr:Hypothetical protein R9X50_00632100 [Acrodontium crateriforme]
MSTAAGVTANVNGMEMPHKPIELSISLPHNPGTRIYLHLTALATSIVLFVTSASIEAGQGGAAMGSLVYAMPDRYNPNQPLSTAMYSSPTSLDFATRLAKLLTRRTQKLCYVGSSMNLSGGAGGGTVEEEMEAFRAIVDVVVSEVSKSTNHE